VCVAITGLAPVVVAAFGHGSALAQSTEPQSDSPPNILFIFIYDQSARTLSCYPNSYSFANTPHIDRLAARGVRFSHAFTGAKCVPSRAMMLTGRLQFNVGERCDRYWAEDFRAQATPPP
jgi:Arylsulfatase A and related enzymes